MLFRYMHVISVQTNVTLLLPLIQAILLKMPGVTTKNVYSLMNKVKDLAELVTLTQEQLTEILDSSAHARSLWIFLHHHHVPTEGATSSTSGDVRGRGGSRGGVAGRRQGATAAAQGTKRKK